MPRHHPRPGTETSPKQTVELGIYLRADEAKMLAAQAREDPMRPTLSQYVRGLALRAARANRTTGA